MEVNEFAFIVLFLFIRLFCLFTDNGFACMFDSTNIQLIQQQWQWHHDRDKGRQLGLLDGEVGVVGLHQRPPPSDLSQSGDLPRT